MARGILSSKRFPALAAGLASLALALPALAAAGDLDPSFGGDGKVRTNFTPSLDEGHDVAIQTNGRIVVVGQAGAGGRFGLARYLPNGNLDGSFGGDGKVRTDVTNGTDSANSVAIQTDGKIVVAGIADLGTHDATFALARYNTDGSLDESFSDDGIVRTSFTRLIDGAHGVAIQADGKIVAAGFAGSSPVVHGGTFALARYDTDGDLDHSFSGDGKVRTEFTDDFDGALDVAIQTDGRIVAAGMADGPEEPFALARYLTSGQLDTSFGDGGKVTTDFGLGLDVAEGVAVQADGRIVAAGFASEPDFVFALARYDSDGNLDDSFSGNGKVKTNFTSQLDWANDVAIQTDGRIVAAGFAETGRPFDPSFALARYNVDGSLDGSFSGNGKLTTNFAEGLDSAEGVAIQVDGRIVAAGVAEATEARGADPTFAVARYLAA